MGKNKSLSKCSWSAKSRQMQSLIQLEWRAISWGRER